MLSLECYTYNKGYLLISQLKCELNMHFISTNANLALNTGLFYALVLILHTKFVPKSPIRRCSSGIIVLDYDAKLPPNIMQICPIQHKNYTLAPLQKLMPIRYHKSAGTKCTNIYFGYILIFLEEKLRLKLNATLQMI